MWKIKIMIRMTLPKPDISFKFEKYPHVPPLVIINIIPWCN